MEKVVKAKDVVKRREVKGRMRLQAVENREGKAIEGKGTEGKSIEGKGLEARKWKARR